MTKNDEKGITLIILVVTIIIIFTIAGLAINAIIKPGATLNSAQEIQDRDKNKANIQTNETNELINAASENMKDKQKDKTGANAPKLTEDMIPVKWNENIDGGCWVVTNEKDDKWYSYKEKKWANVMMRNNMVLKDKSINVQDATIEEMKNKPIEIEGDMFVWIPRFAYQVLGAYHNGGSNVRGVFNIHFLEGITDKPYPDEIIKYDNVSGNNKWNIHPAFTYGEEVSGIWVSKFEASNDNNGNIQIIPNVAMNWNNIRIDDCFQKCYIYNQRANSHMMKNVEWGAVAYLSQSIYGSCNVEKNATQTTGGTNYIVNVSQSTTGNVYGVYDMNGGTNEYVAAYFDNGNAKFTNESKKNVDVYSNYELSVQKYGDSIYETSSKGTDSFAWNQGNSVFVDNMNPYFLRGGSGITGVNTGIFSFEKTNGTSNTYTFRPTLIVH